VHIVYPAVVSALLFSIGVYGVLARRNTILVLMSVELMLNAVNLNLVAFDVWLGDRLHSGQVLTLFVIVIAAAEVGLGLAIVLALYRNRQTIDIDHLRALTEPALDPTGTPTEPAALDLAGTPTEPAVLAPAETPTQSVGGPSVRPEFASASASDVASRRPDAATGSEPDASSAPEAAPAPEADVAPGQPETEPASEPGVAAARLGPASGPQPDHPAERAPQPDGPAERGLQPDGPAEYGLQPDRPAERGLQADQPAEHLPEECEHRVNRGGGD
jgi:NADH:ubiquinone oxidoreductase subunit K